MNTDGHIQGRDGSLSRPLARGRGVGTLHPAGESIVAVLAVFFFSTLAFATTYYVDINSTNPVAPYFSWETASTNIGMAVQKARDGDTVLVADGTYNRTSQIMITRSLTLRSKNGPAKTIIKANRKCRVLSLKSNKGPIAVDGFTITGGYADYGFGNGGGIAAVGEYSILISRCIIEDNEAPDSGGGINVGGNKRQTEKTVIANCVIRNNRAGGHGGGIYVGVWKGNYNPVTIEHCTIIKNSCIAKGSALALVTDQNVEVEGIRVINSIIDDNSGTEVRDINGEIEILNTCFRYASASHENIKINPRFVDEDAGDLRLSRNSPCIESGSNEYSTQSNDLAGNPRITDADQNGEAVVDMGAYEYVVISAEIDIRPGSDNNAVNLKERGLLPVAILTTDSFDVTTINPSSIRFADTKPERRMLQDVDGDGDVDLLLLFKRQRLKLNAESTCALMTGETKDKQPFIGTGVVEVLPTK